MSRMTYMRSWKSLRLTSHTWLGLNPQIGRPLSRIVVPLVYFCFLTIWKVKERRKLFSLQNQLGNHSCQLTVLSSGKGIKKVEGSMLIGWHAFQSCIFELVFLIFKIPIENFYNLCRLKYTKTHFSPLPITK
jgi:hypothetical protein